jgi:LIM domain-binding protein 1
MLQVITEGRLLLEFTFDDLMRIRSWHFAIRQHRELIPRSVIGMQVGFVVAVSCV